MQKILKYDEFIAEGAFPMKLSHSPKAIAGMALLAEREKGKTVMIPICWDGKEERPLVYIAKGDVSEYGKEGTLYWFAFPKNADKDTVGVFCKAAESVTGDTFFTDEDMENGNFEKALEIASAGGI